MKLTNFNGGINIKDAAHLIGINEAVVFRNLDSEPGSLKPAKAMSDTLVPKKKYSYFFEAEQVWIESDVRRDYVTYESTLYWTEAGAGYKYKSGVTTNLGIAKPEVKPTQTVTDAPPRLTQVTINNKTVAGNLPNGNIDYLLVNVDANGNYSKGLIIRVGPSTTTNTTANTSDYSEENYKGLTKVDTSTGTNLRSVEFSKFLGNLGSLAKLFRFYDDAFYLVGNIASLGAVVIDSEVVISSNEKLDNTKFGPLSGTYTYVYTYYNSLIGVESAPSPVSAEAQVDAGKIQLTGLQRSTDPQVDKKIIYRVGGQLAKFTEVARIANTELAYLDQTKDVDLAGDILESTNYFPPAAGLQYLTEAYAMLFGTVGSKLYYTPIGLPNAWPGDYFIECVETITGIGVAANGLFVFTKTGTIIVSGTGPTSLAKSPLSKTQGCISHYSIVSQDGVVYWASTDGICASSGGRPQVITRPKLGKARLKPVQAVTIDEVYYLLQDEGDVLAIDFRYTPLVKYFKLDIDNILVASDVLYGWKADNIRELFAGSSFLEYEYLSPKLSDGKVSEKKTYKKVYIYSRGAIKLDVYIEDVLVQQVDLDGQDTHSIQVPQQYQRGCFIQFKVTGTGEVLELDYTVEGRKE